MAIYLGTTIESSKTFRAGAMLLGATMNMPQVCRATGMSMKYRGSDRPPEFAYCLDAPDIMPAGSTIRNDMYNVFD